MDHFLRYPMLCDMFKYFAGDMWCHGLRADENHLIRTGFQIAMDQGLRPIDVIQSLQICLGIGEYNPESPENLEEAMAGCLKYILTSRHEVSTLRRNLGNIASRISKKSSLGFNEVLAAFEEVAIDCIKQVCKPRPEAKKKTRLRRKVSSKG